MSKAKICRDEAAMQVALEKGLKWLVLRAATVKMYPTLPDLVQSARNAPGQLHKPESQIQVMLRMWNMSTSHLLPSGLPNWTSIHSQISKTCPRIPYAELAALQKFMQAWGGGTHAAHLKYLARFWSSGGRWAIRCYSHVFFAGLLAAERRGALPEDYCGNRLRSGSLPNRLGARRHRKDDLSC